MTPIQSKIKTFFDAHPKQQLERGQQLLMPDHDTLPPITYLEAGRITQYDITSSGTKVILNAFKPHTFFPAPAAINHQTNRFFFEVASTNATIRQAPASDVESFLKDNPDVVYDLLSRVYRGTEGLLGRLSLLLGSPASARLSYELNLQAARFGKETTSGEVIIEITEDELAGHTGLSRETVSRELRKLQESNIIAHTRGSIRLL